MPATNQQPNLRAYERLCQTPPAPDELHHAARMLQGFFELLIEIDREQKEQGYERQ